VEKKDVSVKIFDRGVKLSGPVLAVLCIALLCLGVYKVDNDEAAAVLRFGRLSGINHEERIKRPGLHFAFPYIIDEVVKVPVGKVKQFTVTTHDSKGGFIDTEINRSGYLITGDNNIILIEATVKYRVDDFLAYAFYHKNAELVIDGAVSGVLRKRVSSVGVDVLLTSGKIQLAEDVRSDSQALLDTIGAGVLLTNVELTKLTPPGEVMADFEAVNAATVQKATMIQEANGYRLNILPKAQSQAHMIAENARAFQNERLAGAQTDIAVFLGLYGQYEENPNMVLDGVLRERVAAVLSKMQIIVSGPETPQMLLP
jgi:membrane protease subunit HflK